jgi:ATP-dependent Clp protease ATP-binding subunit ClpC
MLVVNSIYELLSEPALKTLSLALEEARRAGHSSVGTAHLLAGLRSEGTGQAAQALKKMGVNLKYIRLEINRIMGRASGYEHPLPYSPRARSILTFAVAELEREAETKLISTGDLLLGLIREGNGVGHQTLINSGVDLHELKAVVICEIASFPERPKSNE